VEIDGDYVHGDLRRWAQRAAAHRRMLSWSRAEGHVSTVVRGNFGAVQALCKLVRSRGDAEQTLMLLEALCLRVPRHALSRDHSAWPEEMWACMQCDEVGHEAAEHILKCPATEWVRRQRVLEAIHETLPGVQATTAMLDSGVNARRPGEGWQCTLRTALGLTWQVGAPPSDRDAGFAKWSSWEPTDVSLGASGTGWESSWRGRFMLVHTPKRYARATLRRAAKAVEAVRPTRIVVVLPPEGARDLEAAEWVTSFRGKTVVMFQNGMAEATTPCRQGVPDMLRRIHAAPPDWGQRDRAWRQPPAQAWSLDRRV
jgi:hypothetical protein